MNAEYERGVKDGFRAGWSAFRSEALSELLAPEPQARDHALAKLIAHLRFPANGREHEYRDPALDDPRLRRLESPALEMRSIKVESVGGKLLDRLLGVSRHE